MKEKPKLHLDWAAYDAAKYACENWHYTRSMPVGKLIKIGVWENDKFIGVVLFGRGANNNMLKPFKLEMTEGCELVRIALKEHKTPVSRIIAIAIKFLQKKSPSLKLIVSYADADQDHHGGIYQATNWIYTGLRNAGSSGSWIVNGKQVHSKTIHSKGVRQTLDEIRKHLDPKATKYYTKGKHRYLMPLTKEMYEQIKHLSEPYPKRVKKAMASSQLAQRRGSTDLHAPIQEAAYD